LSCPFININVETNVFHMELAVYLQYAFAVCLFVASCKYR
jgi:hypothetical protein